MTREHFNVNDVNVRNRKVEGEGREIFKKLDRLYIKYVANYRIRRVFQPGVIVESLFWRLLKYDMGSKPCLASGWTYYPAR